MTLPQVSLAEQKLRINTHDVQLAQHDRRFGKIDDLLGDIRESCARMATKEDIAKLKDDFSEKFEKRLAEAHDSIPAKAGAVFAAGMFIIALVGLVVNFAHHV